LRKAELRLARGERLRYIECEFCGARALLAWSPAVEASVREQRRGGGFGPLFAPSGPHASSRAGAAEPAELAAAQPPCPAGGPSGAALSERPRLGGDGAAIGLARAKAGAS